MDAAEQKVLDDIAAFGWHCVNVHEDAEGPGFAYSIGFQRTFGQPEVIVFGQAFAVLHGMLNRVAERMRAGHLHRADESYWGILDDFKCHLLTVPQSTHQDYVGWARWYYKDEPFEVLQCVWPDRQGKFQWEHGASAALAGRQPLLNEP
ncbi:MAG: DUF4262 domain-containing protein [Actinomycetota bacterium]|nr:DUF4262 domain-containing protein [Actinomycetota bacterium]